MARWEEAHLSWGLGGGREPAEHLASEAELPGAAPAWGPRPWRDEEGLLGPAAAPACLWVARLPREVPEVGVSTCPTAHAVLEPLVSPRHENLAREPSVCKDAPAAPPSPL